MYIFYFVVGFLGFAILGLDVGEMPIFYILYVAPLMLLAGITIYRHNRRNTILFDIVLTICCTLLASLLVYAVVWLVHYGYILVPYGYIFCLGAILGIVFRILLILLSNGVSLLKLVTGLGIVALMILNWVALYFLWTAQQKNQQQLQWLLQKADRQECVVGIVPKSSPQCQPSKH